ncbi:MAG TPA: asparagine synthase (glutamine-hydrolyzing) [Stellaceae bacterium]|nr:asparagine synthase (glutamine-hydrolyzing) [Stellaceae bacterium]
MCGIAGFVGDGGEADIRAMTLAIAHRGPDGEAYYSDPATALHFGHRRLAIIDLAGGAQPMWDGAGELCLIYNGEIYNHRELRALLVERGHRFRSSHSDTEVLLYGYREWGTELPQRLNGMFAFAIYDRKRRKLFLARDRFGEKPLYYYRKPGLFAFASELTALTRHRRFDAPLSERGLQKFFAYGYIPSPHTHYEGVSKLPPGSHLTLDLESGEVATERYWRFRIEPDESLGPPREAALAEELRALFVQAVRRRLMSDVPLGLFLSGGVDSAAVLAATAQQVPAAEIRSFTIGFREPSFDESAAARATAQAIGSTHREEMLDLGTARALIPEVLARLDEPLGDPSLIPSYLLSRFTRRHVTVALSGDGGDELFAGYDPFQALNPARCYHSLVPGALHRGIRHLAELLPVSTRNMGLDFKIRRALTGLSYPPSLWNPTWMAPVEPAVMRDIFAAPLPVEELYSEAIALWEEGRGKSLVDRTLEFFTNLYLPDDILMKVDRAGMMNSLESRAVFLDNDLVEFCRRLPAHFKYRNGERKYLLKRALAPLLPPAVAARPKKGFGMPVAAWLRDLPPRNATAALPGASGAAVDAAWQAHRSGGADHRLLLWSNLALDGALAQQPEPRLAA